MRVFVAAALAMLVAIPALAAEKVQVFNMIRKGPGRFETNSAGQRPGWRTFGFFSSRTPTAGDVLVKPGNGTGKKSIWAIETARTSFTGSDGKHYWTGTMRDLMMTNTLTQPHIDAVLEAARTQPELLP